MAVAGDPNEKLNDTLAFKSKTEASLAILYKAICSCDTYHDFKGGERGKKAKNEEGDSLNISFTGVSYPAMSREIIEQMNAGYSKVVSDVNAYKNKTESFENSVYKVFTTINNPVIDSLPGTPADISSIKEYLKSLYGLSEGEVFTPSQLGDNYFSTNNKYDNSSPVIDFKLLRVLYTPETSQNIIDFMKSVYEDQVDKENGQLRFVEDASAFPGDIFITLKNSNFKKIPTPHSKWDSGGYTGFPNEGKYTLEKSRAESFNFYDTTKDADFKPTGVEFPGPIGKMSLTNKCGPSVNHLIAHIVAIYKYSPENMVVCNRLVNKTSTKKNVSFPIRITGNMAGVTDEKKTQLYKLYTTYKRSGDHEIIHSALLTDSVLFTGDEPAFVYAMLNKCPAILHLRQPMSHIFRFYIPPSSGGQGELKKEMRILTNIICNVQELYSIFNALSRTYIKFLENFKTALSEPIKFGDNVFCGELLRYLFIDNLISYREVFDQLNTSRQIIREVEGIIKTTSLGELTKSINAIDIKDEAKVRELIDKIKGEISKIPGDYNDKLSDIRKNIPRKLLKKDKLFFAFNEILFEESKKDGLFINTSKSYKINPINLFTGFDDILEGILYIQKEIKLISKSENQRYVAKLKNKILEHYKENRELFPILDAIDFKNTDTAVEAIRGLIAPKLGEIDTLLVTRGGLGKLNKNNITQRIRSDNFKRIYDRICKTKTKIPFGLKANEYASLLVKRLIICDILTRNMNKTISEGVEVSRIPYQALASAAAAGGSYQIGGAVENVEYWSGIFFDYIDPFFKKYIDNSGQSNMTYIPAADASDGEDAPEASPAAAAAAAAVAVEEADADIINTNTMSFAKDLLPEEVVDIDKLNENDGKRKELEGMLSKINTITRTIEKSILDMTFVDDLFTMLEAIATSPSYNDDDRALIETAGGLINRIFSLYRQVNDTKTPRNIKIKSIVQGGFSAKDIRRLYNSHLLEYVIDRSFFQNMNKILLYLNYMLTAEKHVNALDEELTTSFKLYIDNVYPEVAAGAAAPPDPRGASAGGFIERAVSRQRRRRNGSPRRKSLRNR
jgi:hypothetical protein